MKHRGWKFIPISILMSFIGLLFGFFSFMFGLNTGSLLHGLAIWASFTWAGIIALDTRTFLKIFRSSRLNPRAYILSNTAVISTSRIATFLRGSGLFFICLLFGLTPWVNPGFYEMYPSFPTFWHFGSLLVMLPCTLYLLFQLTTKQKITVNRSFIKREVQGLGWKSELISHEPKLNIDVHHSDQYIEFLIANSHYTRESVFGKTVRHFKEKQIPVPETRNIPLEDILIWLFPEQNQLIPIMLDILHEPRGWENTRTKKTEKLRAELYNLQYELRSSTNNDKHA